MTKICKKCGTEKGLDDFHYDKNAKDRHKNVCKSCLSVRRFKSTDYDRNTKQGVQYFIKYGGSFKWGRILGYTGEELKSVLIKQLNSLDLKWEDYTKTWHLSFFIPRTAYYNIDFKNPEFMKLWSLKNLKVVKKEDSCKQKQGIDMKVVKERNLYDILPIGNIGRMLYNKEDENLVEIEKLKKENKEYFNDVRIQV